MFKIIYTPGEHCIIYWKQCFTDAAKIKEFANLTIDWMRMMMEKGTEHPLKHYFPVLVALADAGLDPICRNSPCLVYAYSENASGYTDSIIALTTFDLMAPSCGWYLLGRTPA